jgi:hypothetical protein
VTVGAGAGVVFVTCTKALVRDVPPGPVHVSVNVELACRAALRSLPSTGLVPLQAPDAEHDVAPLPHQLNLTVLPALTVFGLALSTMFGRDCACAREAKLTPNTDMQTASASGAKHDVNFMAGDHMQTRPNTVCLQSATWCRPTPNIITIQRELTGLDRV